MTTKGDRILDRPLAQVGGKGLFIKELEVALADNLADIAVHSMKDVPMELPDGFAMLPFGPREDARDAFVSLRHTTLASLPAGAVVGTSSLRRECQLRRAYPSLVIKPLRGNVNTRLAKLEAGDYDAIILAAAGLKRLGFGDVIRELLPLELALPAIGQGVLAIEYLAARADVAELLAPFVDSADAGRGPTPSARWASSSRAAARCRSAGTPRSRAPPSSSRASWACPTARSSFASGPRAPRPTPSAVGRALGERILARGGRDVLDLLAQLPK